MKHLITLAFALGLSMIGTGAHAQCFADYKARDARPAGLSSPLRLQYGIIELPEQHCAGRDVAAAYARPFLAERGWTLLQIESIFGPDVFERRSANAGAIHRRQ